MLFGEAEPVVEGVGGIIRALGTGSSFLCGAGLTDNSAWRQPTWDDVQDWGALP